MDYDLFEDCDFSDEQLLSAQPTTEATQCVGQSTNDVIFEEIVYEFQCSGEDSLKSQFTSLNSFVKNAFINKEFTYTGQVLNERILAEIVFAAYDFKANHLRSEQAVQYAFGKAIMNIQRLAVTAACSGLGAASSLPPSELSSWYQIRREVTLLYHLILSSTYQEQWPLLEPWVATLRDLVGSLTTSPDNWKAIYYANSHKGNDSPSPSYHYLHGILEWKLLDLCILRKYVAGDSLASSVGGACGNLSLLVQQLHSTFEELIWCSLHLYSKKASAVELLYSSPFPCTCFKEFWLLLQLAINKWFDGARDQWNFWLFYNEACKRVETKLESISLTKQRFYEFNNWLMAGLVRLYGYRSNGQYEGPNYSRVQQEQARNYEFAESNTKKFLDLSPQEEQLRIFICLLQPTLLDWWQPPRVNALMLLWEYFYKRLNSSFYAVGAGPQQLAVTCQTGKAYLLKYRELLAASTTDANLSSYTLFVLLLGRTVGALLRARLQNPMQKVLGRIYTKFSIQKFLTLNETGIHHLIELFLVLALSGDFQDLGTKLRDKLLSIPMDDIKVNVQVALLKGHMALLMLHKEQGCDLEDYIRRLLQQLKQQRLEPGVARILGEGFIDIVTGDSNGFARGAYLLIEDWLPHYLNTCSAPELDRTLEALHSLLQKMSISNIDADEELVKALNAHILPFVKQNCPNGQSKWLPELAADFCIHPGFVTDSGSFQRLFQYFVEATSSSKRSALPQFLLRILDSNRKSFVNAKVIMHTWLKSLVLLTANDGYVKKLTQQVTQLEEFRFMTKLEEHELYSAKEPLWLFISSIGKTYDHCDDFRQRCLMADNLNLYLRNFEKWLPADLWHQESYEVVARFHSFLAIVIYNCAQMIYEKSKITCFFHVALTRYVLTTNIQMGKAPEPMQAQVVHKIWPVLLQGIGRLSYKTDPYLSKTLSDLIQKWTPKFKISSHSRVVAQPYVLCLQGSDPAFSLHVFEKLANLFLTTQRRQPDVNACLVITIFQEVLSSILNNSSTKEEVSPAVREERLQTLLKATCLHLLEHLLMVDELVASNTLILEFFKTLLHAEMYERSVALQELLSEQLRLIIKKHLAYHTLFVFELLTKFAHLNHKLIENVETFLLSEMQLVQHKRGVAEDFRMRDAMDKLQRALAAERKR